MMGRLLGISYRYADEPAVSDTDSGELDQMALARLPDELRDGLVRAVQLRAFSQTAQLAKTIADREPSLGQALGKLVGAFDWAGLDAFLVGTSPSIKD